MMHLTKQETEALRSSLVEWREPSPKAGQWFVYLVLRVKKEMRIGT